MYPWYLSVTQAGHRFPASIPPATGESPPCTWMR
jgi:hypothetical protein